MSTSPEKDLHSVYIDGEMPENFVSQYEAAVKDSEKAQSELKKMQVLHEIFATDAKSKTIDQNFADQSFERLQSRLSYSKTISVNKQSNVLPFIKYASSFAAAAAVFAVVFIPMHNKAVSEAKTPEVAAIEIKTEEQIQPISEKQVVIDGSLRSENLSQGIAVASNKSVKEENKVEEAEKPVVEQKTVMASAMVSNGGYQGNRSRFRHSLPSVDPFRPNFSSPSGRISVPKIQEMSNNQNNTQEQQ